MQRSLSLNKISNKHSPKIPRQNSYRALESYRLNFPIVGDTSLYANYGKKHFDNHSDKMTKIILPFRYAAQKISYHPTTNQQLQYHRQNLIQQNQSRSAKIQKINKKESQGYNRDSNVINKQKDAKFNQRVATEPIIKQQNYFKLGGQSSRKYDDELDKLQKYLDLKKYNNPETPKVTDKVTPRNINPTQSFTEKSIISQNQPLENVRKTPNISIVTNPTFTPVLPSKLQMPKERPKYDIAMSIRSRNPTHLSTGLSII